MSAPIRNVLFLCTGNSARSILAECALNRLGEGRFRGYSAGSHPKPAPHPVALTLLRQLGYDTADLRSKSWDEFAAPGAPPMHFVFTVCANAAGETCPVWPRRPVTAHWGLEDPADARGSEEEQLRVFRRAYEVLAHRIGLFVALPFEELDGEALSKRLEAIGHSLPSA
ncbi:MAG: arsenate reductase ArsC [Myxococcota bacterium]